MVETYEIGRFPSLLQETLQRPLASWHLLSLGAACTVVSLMMMMVQLLGDDGRVAFMATSSSPLLSLTLSLPGVSALGALPSSLTCKRSRFLQSEEERTFRCRYRHTCGWLGLTHSDWHFVQMSLKHSLSRGIIITNPNQTKKQKNKC